MKEESPCKVLIWLSELQITDHNHRLICLSPQQLHILADEYDIVPAITCDVYVAAMKLTFEQSHKK